MDSAVKTRQRAALLAHVQSTQPAPMPSTPENASKPAKTSKKWMGFTFGFIGMMAALALVLVFVSPNGLKLPGASPAGSVALLAIPAAHAEDAFGLTADKADAAGTDTDSSFTVTSKIDVDAPALKQSLTILPPVDVDVQKTANNTFKVTPKENLQAGETYRFSIAAEVDNGDGTVTHRTFSWAMQAKDDFRVLSSIPGDGKSYVPVNTGIEFKFSRDGFEGATSSFSITPAVAGHFETHGRSLSFVPDAPLAYGQRYEVTLKKGFGATGSDKGLAEDAKLRFETETAPKPGTSSSQPLEVSLDEYQEIVPAKPWSIQNVYLDKSLTGFSFEAYRLTKDDARKLLDARLNVPAWAPVENKRFAAYEQATKTMVSSGDAPISRNDSYSGDIQLPAFDPGFYAVKITPNAPQGGVASWVFVQSTEVAAYMTADQNSLLVWTVNAATGKVLSNERVRVDGQDVKTDAQGLAHLATPSVLNATSSDFGDVPPHVLAEFGDDQAGLLQPIMSTNGGYWVDFNNRSSSVSKTWGYLYLDRPLYRQQDELKLFGVAQDRLTRQGAGQVEVRLRKQDYWVDFGTGRDKVYQSKTVTTDASGRYEATFDWDQLSQGYYTIEVMRGDEVVSNHTFEVREFVKPAYQLSLMLDQHKVFAGQPITGTVKANFFEGTPVPHLKLVLNWNNSTLNLETDDTGVTRFSADNPPQPCAALSPIYSDCGKSQYVSFEVRPEGGEEGDIYADDATVVYRSEAGTRLEARSTSTTASVRVTVWKNNLSLDDDGQTTGWAGRPVTVTVYGHHWEKQQDGFTYDYLEKKNVPRYRYVDVWDAPAVTNLTTDGSGQATMSFTMSSDRDYEVFSEARDDSGRVSRDTFWIWPGQDYGSYGGRAMPGDTWNAPAYPSLDLTPHADPNGPVGFGLDQRFTATFKEGNDSLDASRTPGVLFFVASRGLRQSEVKQANTDSFTFQEAWSPNADIHAVTFHEGHFEEVQQTASFRRQDKSLVIEAKPDKESYAPGETVHVTVTAKRKSDGQAAPDTKLAWGAVDKSLLAASYDVTADPLAELYGYVSDGLIFTSRSHGSGNYGFGGAEMGGGGGEMARLAMDKARKNFKDTAGFGVVTTDANGSATITFQAPDNITGWRFELVGVTPALEAGEGRTDVNVTKPVFVDLVAPPRLLVNDKPVLKLRAYGAGLADGEDVTFAVKAPTLGIDQEVPGKANQPVSVAIPNLVAGKHTVTVAVASKHGTDALEREITVEPSNYLKDSLVSVQAAPGTALPSLGQPEADITITPGNRAALQPLAEELVWNSGSARADALLASRLALQILKDDYRSDSWWLPDADSLTERLSQYQNGGMELLPYGSADLELSSEMAATAPEYLDRDDLSSYFWNIVDDPSTNRSDLIEALAGLAALHEPVLTALQQASALSDLGWRERLSIARGLAAAGDTERARGLLDGLLATAVQRDNLTSLHVTESDADNYEATADAAALAAQLAHPQADALMRFVQSNWRADAFPVLAKARYLKSVIPTLGNRDITFGYTLGDGEKTILFKDGWSQTLTLTSEEASKFRVTKADGPITISFVKRETGRPVSVPEVSVERTYQTANDLSHLKAGDAVTITLTPRITASAQDGCYVVRDHLPGGWEAMTGQNPILYGGDGVTGGQWYPYLVENGEVSFSFCKGESGPIVYTARVVSPGTYTAEAPLIQNQSFPGVASVGKDQSVTIQ